MITKLLAPIPKGIYKSTLLILVGILDLLGMFILIVIYRNNPKKAFKKLSSALAPIGLCLCTVWNKVKLTDFKFEKTFTKEED